MREIVLIFIMIVFAQACTEYKIKEVTDFSKEQVIILNDEAKSASSIELFVKGNIDGEIKVILKENFDTKSWHSPAILSGKIDTLLRSGDWYNDTIFMFIQPLGIAKGNLSVKYVIHGSII